MKRRLDLTNPLLGPELLRDPMGELPIDVWDNYFWCHSDEWRPVFAWSVDPADPEVAPIDPQRAVDEAEPLVAEVIQKLRSNPSDALMAAQRAVAILVHGSSDYQPKRGKTASMQHIAVRAYVIRKFNPDPDKPGKSTVEWHKLADMLFLEHGKCSRCSLIRHQYDSRCVKALMTAVTHLHTAMKHDGIPV